MTKQRWIEPNQEQQDQALHAQIAIVEICNRLIREGFAPPIVIAGMGAAVCDVLTTVYGNSAVPPWFQKQADMTAAMIGAKH